MMSVSVGQGQLFIAKGMLFGKQIVRVHHLLSVTGIPSLQEGPVKESSPAGA